jgi:L-fucose mutarotase
MLKNIDPLLTPDLLKLLAEMGHEDAIVIADANFTAMRYRETVTSRTVIRMPGISLARAAQAVLSVLPLTIASERPVAYMQAGNLAAGQRNGAQQAVIDLLAADSQTKALPAHAYERFDFYEAAQKAYVIVQTGEMAPYANFIFKKGVIAHHAGV